MSFDIGALRVNGTLRLDSIRLDRSIGERLTGEFRDALNVARKEGEEFLKGIVPIETHALQDSAKGGTNQNAVWFSVKAAPRAPREEQEYGVYQNYGFHSRPGHYYMERTQAFAADVLRREVGIAVVREGFLNAITALPGGGTIAELTDPAFGQRRTFGPQFGPHFGDLTNAGKRAVMNATPEARAAIALRRSAASSKGQATRRARGSFADRRSG